LPPDVRYRLKDPEPPLKLDSLNSGFAARCEIRLKDPELPLKLDSLNSGFAADVRYVLKIQSRP